MQEKPDVEQFLAFEQFWSIYPRKVAKKAARKAYDKAINEGAERDKILTAVLAYKKWLAQRDAETWRPEPAHPTSWLNQGRWEDELEDAAPVAQAVSFKITEDLVKKLRGGGLTDSAIKRWFDEAKFTTEPGRANTVIFFKSQFVRDYVQNNFADRLRRAFGDAIELIVEPGRALMAG